MIILTTDTAPQIIRQKMREHKFTAWAYIGSNHATLLGLENILSDLAEGLPVHERAQTYEWLLRSEYVQWLDALYEPGLDSLPTRISMVADKNTSNSNLFHSLLLMYTFIQMMKESSHSVLVCCDDVFQGRSLAKTLRGLGYRDVRCEQALRRTMLSWCRSAAIALRDICTEFIRLLRLCRECRSLPTPQRPGPCLLVLTALDRDSFGTDGVLSDRTFPGLFDWARNNGHQPLLFPQILANRKDYSASLAWLIRHIPDTFIPWRHLRIPDLCKALAVFLAQGVMPLPPRTFQGIETRPMTRFLRLNQLRHVYKLMIAAYPAALRNLARTTKLKRAIIRYENSPLCKAVTFGIRKAWPQAVVLGYQHSAIAPFMLKYTCSRQEYSPLFQPDIILSNGPWFTERLRSDGFPRDRIQTGPTLRSPFLFSNFQYVGSGQPIPRILVPMPLDLNAARELAEVLRNTFAHPGYEVLVKLHPFADRNEASQCIAICEMGSGMRFVEGEIFDQLRLCDAVTGLASAVLMEAAALGIPTFPIRRRVGVDLNTLAWFADAAHYSLPSGNDRELRERLDHFFTLPVSGRISQAARLAGLVRNCYSQSATGYEMFLEIPPGLPRAGNVTATSEGQR
ncbi:MAG: hypothetical protein RDU24_02670 [Humidesulfovibrio sp.]|uniref:hypothetical protein n=1 Tax=Humidesulfovibrio sp. TaxID=2910988 RepID=UPI0027EB3332|nr:hypothetical protein [Humidesulfovibrio sp.]MDQ7834262.1 hypothetical protein [Humidesulfovibrio sp.]